MPSYSGLGLLTDYPDLFTGDIDRFIQDHAVAIDASPEVKGALSEILGGISRLAVALPKAPALHAELISQPMPKILRTGATNRLLEENQRLLEDIRKLLAEGINSAVEELKKQGTPKPEEGDQENPVALQLQGLLEEIRTATEELREASKAPRPTIQEEPPETLDSKAVAQAVLGMVLNQPLEVLFTQALDHWLELFTEHLRMNRWVDWEYMAAAEHQIKELDLLRSLLTKKDRKRLGRMADSIEEAIEELRRRRMVHHQLNTPPAVTTPQRPSQPRPSVAPAPAPQPAPAAQEPPPAVALETGEDEGVSRPRRESRHGQPKAARSGGTDAGDGDGPRQRKGKRGQEPPPPIQTDDGDESLTLGARATVRPNGKNGGTDQPPADLHPLSAVASGWVAKDPGSEALAESESEPAAPSPAVDPPVTPTAPDPGDDPDLAAGKADVDTEDHDSVVDQVAAEFYNELTETERFQVSEFAVDFDQGVAMVNRMRAKERS